MATPASRLAVGDTFAPFFSGLLKPGSVVSVSRNSDGLDMFVRVDDTDEPISHSKAYSHTARIWATPGVPGKGKRLKLDPAYSFVFEGVRGYTYGEKWRLRHISTENGAGAGSAGKVTIPVLTKRVEASARLAGANRRGQEIDPRVAESEWDRIFVVHGLRNYGAPVQRSMRDSFMTAFWRGAARGLANPAVRLGRGLDEIALAVDTVPRLTRERLLDDSGARVMELVIRRMSLSVDEAEQIAKEASRRDGGPASGKRVAEVFQELDRGVMDMNAAQRLERLANPAGKVEKNPKPAVTDRALRYRANANPPKGPKRCLFCGSTRNVEVGHLDGHEENNDRSNLAWNCRSCNTTLGHAFKKLGIGRRTRQYNPEGGAKSLGQWVQALQSLRGESGTMEPAAALEMIRATPADDRSAYS